jgi:hypothetical protein
MHAVGDGMHAVGDGMHAVGDDMHAISGGMHAIGDEVPVTCSDLYATTERRTSVFIGVLPSFRMELI